MMVVAPKVDLYLTTDGNAVNIGAKHLTPIDQQTRMTNTIMIIGSL